MKTESQALFEFKKEVEALKTFRGRGTELISVYITPGYQVSDVVAKLRDEYGQAANIKSKSTQKNVQAALERIMHYLKGYRAAPKNGLAVFAGNVSEKEGKIDYQLFAVEPPVPLGIQFYRCESTFVLEPLEELMDHAGCYGLVVLDGKDATVATLKGKQTRVIKKLHSTAHQKVHKGGQCIHEDELICLGDGRITPIKNVLEGDFLSSLDFEKLKTKNAECDAVMLRESREALLLKTKNPLCELKVTPEHSFFVVTENGFEEKQATELREGDYLLIASELPAPTREVPTDAILPKGTPVVSKEGREKLVEARHERGLLQREVAEASGFDQGSISELERGAANFGQNRLNKLIGYYGFNASEFEGNFIEREQLVCFPSTVTAELAQITGYFLGDGCFDGNRLRFYEGNPQLAEYYARLIERLFGASTRTKKRKSGWGECLELTAYNKWLVQLFKETFPELIEKSIPERITASPNEVTAGFLRGLFDAEGSASSGRVSLAMANEKAVKTAWLLLRRFEIIASFGPKKSENKQQYYLDISDKASLERFNARIGFASKKKQAKLQEIILEKSDTNYRDQAAINGLLVKKLARAIGLKNSDFKGVPSFLNGKRNLSRKLFKERILSTFKKKAVALAEKEDALAGKAAEITRALETIAYAQVVPAKLVKKERCPAEGVYYDLSLPETLNFIVNGIVVHNSAARYDRLHVEGVEYYYKRIGEAMDAFVGLKNFKGVVVGGPGPAKHDFVKMKPFNYQLELLGVVDTGYTDEYGIRETIAKASELMKGQEAVKEKQVLNDFLKRVSKGGLAAYGYNDIHKAVESGQAEKLLVTEDLEMWQIKQKCNSCKKERVKIDSKPGNLEPCDCGGKWKVVEEHDLVNDLIGKAEENEIEVEFVSKDTSEGNQFYGMFNGLGAFLRYK